MSTKYGISGCGSRSIGGLVKVAFRESKALWCYAVGFGSYVGSLLREVLFIGENRQVKLKRSGGTRCVVSRTSESPSGS